MIDRQIILTVLWILGGNAVVLIAGIVYSSLNGTPVDNGVSTLAGTVIGYIGGILTRVDKLNPSPTETKIVNDKTDPVPTEPQ